jgi:thiol-disulfide isomerase/thioredoxin
MSDSGLRAVGAALVVVLGCWAGAKFYSSRHLVPEGVVAVPAGQASAPNPSDLGRGQELPTPQIPDRLPAFALADRDGKLTPIASFAGKSLIINFWATWCAPCRSEIPLLESLHGEWASRGVSVVGIAVDLRDKVLEYSDRLKIPYPVLIGEQDALDAAAALGVPAPVFPFTVFTDRRGEVVALFVGELHRPQAELILAQVEGLNRGQIQLSAARAAIAAGLSALKHS